VGLSTDLYKLILSNLSNYYGVGEEVEKGELSVKLDTKWLGLVKDDAQNQDKWRTLTIGNRPTLSQCGNEEG